MSMFSDAWVGMEEILDLIANLEQENESPRVILDKVKETCKSIRNSSKDGWY